LPTRPKSRVPKKGIARQRYLQGRRRTCLQRRTHCVAGEPKLQQPLLRIEHSRCATASTCRARVADNTWIDTPKSRSGSAGTWSALHQSGTKTPDEGQRQQVQCVARNKRNHHAHSRRRASAICGSAFKRGTTLECHVAGTTMYRIRDAHGDNHRFVNPMH
jgi:hypothetical protein